MRKLFLLFIGIAASGFSSAWAGPAEPYEEPQWLDGYRARYRLRVAFDPAEQAAETVVANLPGCWIDREPGSVVVQAESGEVLPVIPVQNQTSGNAMIRFPRRGNSRWFWAYVLPRPNAKPPELTGPNAQDDILALQTAEEGLVAEVRRWNYPVPESWESAESKFAKAKTLGTISLPEISMAANPVDPGSANRFVSRYRGYIKITEPGKYRFYSNSHGATFFFLDGKKVFERPGENDPVHRVPTFSTGGEVELVAGLHPFEFYHFIGPRHDGYAMAILVWLPPESNDWGMVPHTAFSRSLTATVCDLQGYGGKQAANIAYGIDDVFKTESVNLYLVRFQAVGTITNRDQLKWDFGDGTTATGQTVYHLYASATDFTVKLNYSPDLPPCEKEVSVWSAGVESSPLSLAKAVDVIDGMALQEIDPMRLSTYFGFLLDCEQPNRWPVLEKVARRLLEQTEYDLEARTRCYAAIIKALAAQNEGAEAVTLAEKVMAEFDKYAVLKARVMLTLADVYRDYIRDFQKAQQSYETLIDEFRRINDPVVREAAIHMGDMLTWNGDLEEARQAYQLASKLGGDAFDSSAQADAVAQGAMLRLAEQSLQRGDVRQTRRLLEQIELKFPEQRLGGLCCFMRAETERQTGRYEQALRNYNLLLNLVEWAGYRDKTIFGIADCFYRMNDYEAAMNWLAMLKESFPEYYEEQNVADYEELLKLRLDEEKQLDEVEPLIVDFDEDPTPVVRNTNFIITKGMGIDGSKVALGESITHTDYKLTLRPELFEGAKAGDYFWVEFWYKNTMPSRTAGWYGYMGTWFSYSAQGENSRPQIRTDYTYGDWFKAGVIVQAPTSRRDVIQELTIGTSGVLEIDRFRMMPVTARQHDILQNFLESEELEE